MSADAVHGRSGWRWHSTGLALGAVLFAITFWLWQRPTIAPAAESPRDALALAASIGPSMSATHLAAEPLSAGHWRFANAAGTMFTASSPSEVERAFASLLPGNTADSKRPRPVLRLPLDAVRLPADAFAALPPDIPLQVWTGAQALPLDRRSGPTPRLNLTDRVQIETSDPAAAAAAISQLARPLRRGELRLIALVPGGPVALPRAPRTDPTSGHVQIDVLDPPALISALASLRGGTALIIGRPEAEGADFVVRTATGQSARLSLAPILAAAAANDVTLLVLQAANAIQPGGRNWYWRTIDVAGLPQPTDAPTRADAITAMLGGHRVLATPTLSSDRLTLSVRRAEATGVLDTALWRGVLQAATADVFGQANVTAAIVALPSATRQAELDRRWIPLLPSGWQVGLLGLLLAIGIGAPTAWRWWARVWPAEQRADYAHLFGYGAARVVRGLAFVAIFLPLVGLVAAPFQLWRMLSTRDRKPAH